RSPRVVRSASGAISVAAALVIWLALLGPVITLAMHISPGAARTALTSPGALEPLVVSVKSGAVTLAVLLVLGTPLAWLLARGRLPFPRVWEAGLLLVLLLPPLVIGLLLVFMIGPFTPVGHGLEALHLSATNTFLALVIAQVYESAPYYVLGAMAAARADPRARAAQPLPRVPRIPPATTVWPEHSACLLASRTEWEQQAECSKQVGGPGGRYGGWPGC